MRRMCTVWGVVWLSLCACEEKRAVPEPTASGTGPQATVAHYKGGAITREEMQREAQRLPPALREQFESPAGQREFASSLVDKRLLAEEARRRGMAQRPEIARQVRELEERLIIQALLAEEERASGAVSEEELRAYYDANKRDFQQPESVHLARVLAAVAPGSTAAERSKARARAETFARRLLAGEPMARVYSSGDGPERARNGELGLFTRGDSKDRRLEEAAFALARAGQVSPVVETADGFAVLQLLERRPARIPPFEEVRAEVEGRLGPVRQRKAFDNLRLRLRSEADVHIEVTERP